MSRVFAHEATRAYAYDKAGQLTTLALPSDPVGQHTTYTYDRAGLSASRSLPDGSVAEWGYDAAGRLTSLAETMPSGVLAFAYERNANGQVIAENGTRYAYDALNRLSAWYDPSADATTTYGYEANYNLTSVSVDGTQTRGWRLSSKGISQDRRVEIYSDLGYISALGEDTDTARSWYSRALAVARSEGYDATTVSRLETALTQVGQE